MEIKLLLLFLLYIKVTFLVNFDKTCCLFRLTEKNPGSYTRVLTVYLFVAFLRLLQNYH